MNKSQTPRTDAQIEFIKGQLKEAPSLMSDHPYYVLDVMARLCRTLERELDVAESFHKVAITERNYERARADGLEEKLLK